MNSGKAMTERTQARKLIEGYRSPKLRHDSEAAWSDVDALCDELEATLNREDRHVAALTWIGEIDPTGSYGFEARRLDGAKEAR